MPVFVPHASDSMSEHALATAEAHRERFGQAVLRTGSLKGDWSFEDMPPLGDDVGFFEFDVSKGLFIEPGEYECVVFTHELARRQLGAECKVPAFTLAEQSRWSRRLDGADARRRARSFHHHRCATRAPQCRGTSATWWRCIACRRERQQRRERRAESRTSSRRRTARRADGANARRACTRCGSRSRCRRGGHALASARLTVEKPARKRSTLQLDGEVLRFARKVSVSWDIEASLSVSDREQSSRRATSPCFRRRCHRGHAGRRAPAGRDGVDGQQGARQH
jgi:hypothetical protein